MVERATREWGSVDLLCANAGILRDKSFTKNGSRRFRQGTGCPSHRYVLLLQGGVGACASALRPHRRHHLVVGLFGNFGQANYGAPKPA